MRTLGLWRCKWGLWDMMRFGRWWGYEIIRRVQRSSLLAFHHAATAATKLLQSCPTLCDPRDGSPPGSPIPGILQARTLEWVAISFSKAWKWKVKVKSHSHVRLLETPWTAAYQAPPSMGFSRQEYWTGVPLPSLPYESSMKRQPYATRKRAFTTPVWEYLNLSSLQNNEK